MPITISTPAIWKELEAKGEGRNGTNIGKGQNLLGSGGASFNKERVLLSSKSIKKLKSLVKPDSDLTLTLTWT